jgi:hypothetical protein
MIKYSLKINDDNNLNTEEVDTVFECNLQVHKRPIYIV